MPAVQLTQKGLLRKRVSQCSKFEAPGVDKAPSFGSERLHECTVPCTRLYQTTERKRGAPTTAGHWKHQPATKRQPDSTARQTLSRPLPVNNTQVADRDTGVEFGLLECSTCTGRTGKRKVAPETHTREQDCIQHLAQHSTCKCLGTQENATLQHKK